MEQQEPSMEEILSSIRRILSHEEGEHVVEDKIEDNHSSAEENIPNNENAVDVMELTEDMRVSAVQNENVEYVNNAKQNTSVMLDDMVLLSEDAVQASTDRLAHLVETVSSPKMHDSKSQTVNTALEELVSSLLRPYLKEWLDSHLPDLIEQIVQKEIQRLTSKVNLS